MASELRVNTLKDASGNNSVATSTISNGVSKHYVNYDAQNQATDDSLNQSSLTDVATGEFYSTFTSAMSSATAKAHYVSALNSQDDGANDTSGAVRAGVHMSIGRYDNHRALSASEVSFSSAYGAYSSGNGAASDLSMTCCMTLGDLA